MENLKDFRWPSTNPFSPGPVVERSSGGGPGEKQKGDMKHHGPSGKSWWLRVAIRTRGGGQQPEKTVTFLEDGLLLVKLLHASRFKGPFENLLRTAGTSDKGVTPIWG